MTLAMASDSRFEKDTPITFFWCIKLKFLINIAVAILRSGRLWTLGVFTFYGMQTLIRDIGYFRKRLRLIEEYPNGFICNGSYYSITGSVSTDLPDNVPIVPEELLPEKYLKIMQTTIVAFAENTG
jgi:hypothetical protein